MWKTEEFKVGKEFNLDAPNGDAVVRFIPLMWLPGEINKQVIARMQQDEDASEDVRPADALGARMDGIYAVIPHLVSSWDLKDPDTGLAIESPRAMLNRGDLSILKGLPSQILIEIVNRSISWGTDDDELVVATNDPDVTSGAAQAIPFVNETVSEVPSLLGLVQVS